MKNYICLTCGTQYAAANAPPEKCAICEDERQYVNWKGQQWTTLEEMWQADYRNDVREIEPNLIGIGTEPAFGIGQRALLVRTDQGNVLWDPISYLDSQTIEAVYRHGGIHAISASHPHFYASMVAWSLAFDHVPIFLPEADQRWIMRPVDGMVFFKDRRRIFSGVDVVRCGGHFPGSAVLAWENGAGGKGALLVGDTLMVAMDRKSVSFMYSYPNLVPLTARQVSRVIGPLASIRFDRIYSAWWEREITRDAKHIVDRSARAFMRVVADGEPPLAEAPKIRDYGDAAAAHTYREKTAGAS